MSDVQQLQSRIDALENRLGRTEDELAIRRLHHSYGYFMDYCYFDDVIDLFTQDGEASFLSGVYRGRAGLTRLYKDFLGGVYSHGKRGPIHGFLSEHCLLQDVITVAQDRRSARGRFKALLMYGSHPTRVDNPGEIPEQVYEFGVHENEYVRDDGVWKIRRLNYALQWQALYDKGWAHTEVTLPASMPCFPDSPLGPDFHEGEPQKMWPERSSFAFHFPHPVTGQAVEHGAA